MLMNVTTGEELFVDVRKPTFRVETANERKPINLTIPCTF
jgi:hypothetical protein